MMIKVHDFESGFGVIEDFQNPEQPEDEKRRNKRLLFALDEKQRKELLEIAKEKNYKHYLMIRLTIESGLRVNELVNLTIPDLDYQNNRISVNSRDGGKYYLKFNTKNQSSKRLIIIDSHMMNDLRSFIGARTVGYVFESKYDNMKYKGRFNKRSIINMVNRYAKKCKTINATIGMHCLRRTYASYLADNQEKVGIIQKQLGHTSVATTMKYIHSIHSEADYENTRKLLRKMNK